MRLTKYQKARLLEYEWDIINHGPDDENTSWLQIDKEDGRVFEDAKNLLGYKRSDIENLKVLIVASKDTTTSCIKNV